MRLALGRIYGVYHEIESGKVETCCGFRSVAHAFRFDVKIWIYFLETFAQDFDLFPPYCSHGSGQLAVDVRWGYDIIVYDRDVSDPGTDKRLRAPAANPTDSKYYHPRFRDRFYGFFAKQQLKAAKWFIC